MWTATISSRRWPRLVKRPGGRFSGSITRASWRRETSQAKAERVVGEESRRLGWHEGDLTRRPKGDLEKMALAARLRRETTLTIQQIAQRVHLGTSRSANARLHVWMHPKAGVAPRKINKGAKE